MHVDGAMKCRIVRQMDDPALDLVERTYNGSFPEVERRDFALVRQLIADEPAFQLRVFCFDGCYVGFISNWQFEGFRYAEHFAIDPAARNGGIGTKVLRHFLALSEDPVVLEVELPEDEWACRRIGFYERQGFRLDTHRYLQPPYRSGGEAIELRLMTYGTLDLSDRFEEVSRMIHHKVYGVRTQV